MRCVVLLAILLAAGCAGTRPSNASPADYRAHRLDFRWAGPIAVVPFQNTSGRPDAGQRLADMFQEELVKSRRVAVIPRETVAASLAPFAGKDLPPDELGKKLNARSLVVGSVSQYGVRRGQRQTAVAVTMQLIDARTGNVLWKASRTERPGSLAGKSAPDDLARAVSADLARSMLECDRP